MPFIFDGLDGMEFQNPLFVKLFVPLKPFSTKTKLTYMYFRKLAQSFILTPLIANRYTPYRPISVDDRRKNKLTYQTPHDNESESKHRGPGLQRKLLYNP